MAMFQYKVRDQQGKKLQGFMEAENEKLVAEKLRNSGYFITFIEKSQSSRQWGVLTSAYKISRRALTNYLRVFSIILDFGLPLNTSLVILSKEIKHPKLRRVTENLIIEIEKGNSLGGALDKFPEFFSEMFRAMIKAGEARGRLKEVIQELILFYEQEGEIREKTSSAIGYPLMICSFLTIVLIGVLTIFLPHVANITNSIKLKLSPTAQSILALSNFLHNKIYIICILVLITAGIYFLTMRKESVRYARDNFLLQIPVVGRVIRKKAIARSYLAVTALLKCGLSTQEAFAIAQAMTANLVIADELGKMPLEIWENEGEISPEEVLFSLPDLRLFVLGERAMTLELVLVRLGDLYLKEVYYLYHYYLRNGLLLLICLLLALMIGIIFLVDLPIMDWAAASIGQ